ncbi:MAG: amidase, partial [Ilumatobacteraceae bacterium]
QARAEAEGDLPDGPFRGVPFLVKDLGCAMAGEPMHMGCGGLKRAAFRSPVDSFLYESFRAAGVITLGRTNTPEFGSTVTTEPVAYGPTRNPWNIDHSTGGSSGGSAAAVAAGMVTMAHANDGGGSIRIPAGECGLVGLKPSRARVSQGPMLGEGWAGATIDGVITHSVRDTASMLDAISGRRLGDPYVAAPPRRPFADEVGATVGSLRIGLTPSLPASTTDPECSLAVERAGELLESLGHHVQIARPAEFYVEDYSHHFITVLAANSAADLAAFAAMGIELGPDDLEPDNWAMTEIGATISARDYLASITWLHAWSRRLQAWWNDFDVLVTPTLAVPPPPIGWLSDPVHGTERLTGILLYTAQLNTSGQPAVSLPLHWTPDGLPVGVQFVGAIDDEAGLIRLAAQIESAEPWAQRTPPVFG